MGATSSGTGRRGDGVVGARWRTAGWALALAGVAAAVLVLAPVRDTTSSPDVATLAAARPCRPVTLVAVSGRGPGSTVLDAVTDPVGATRAEKVAVLRVPAPADASAGAAARATDALATSLAGAASTCPDARFVLLGWSEGARVAGDLAARIGTGQEQRVPVARVLAVGLFGDPARGPAGRVVPERVPGAGVVASRGGFGALEGRTIEICAPDDPVCASPQPSSPLSAGAAAAPAHAAYARLRVAPGLTATDWAVRSLSRLIDTVPAAPTTQTRPTTPSNRPRPTTQTGATTQTRPTPDRPASGLLLDSTVGDLASHFDNSANSGLVEGGDTPKVVTDPLDPSGRAFAFTVPGGAKRSEILPEGAQHFREGEHWFFGYVGSVAPDFPVDAADGFQIVLQLHDGGSNVSPPVALEIEKGQLWVTSGGSAKPDRSLGPVEPGRPMAVQLEVRFQIGGGSVSAWRDGRPVITDWRPPKGTMVDDHDYLKVGLYRSGRIGRDGTVFLHELKIGRDLDSVRPAGDGAAR